MSISDAQFAQWLKDQASSLTVLAEIRFGYQSAGVPAQGTIYLSDRGYVSKPTDSPANQRYRGVIQDAPDVERAISLEQLGGRGVMSEGDLTLGNTDGSLDFLLDVIVDGRNVNFYVGDKDWPRADFRFVNAAAIAVVKAGNDDTIALSLRDKNYLLDATMIGTAISSGPNAGKPKPILIGYVNNFDVTPYLIDAAALTYYINDFAMSSIFRMIGVDVRDSGVSLTTLSLFTFSSGTMTADAATDTLTFTAHGLSLNDVIMCWPSGAGSWFAGLSAFAQYWVINPTANTFQLSLTRGGAAVDITGTVMTGSPWTCDRRRFYIDFTAATLQLSSKANGRPTLDILALDAGGEIGSDAYPEKIFLYVLKHYTSLAATDYDSTAITNLMGGILRYAGVQILDRRNVMDVLDELAIVTNAWYAWNAAGVLTMGRLDLQNLDAATAIDTITSDDIEGDPSCENQPLPFGRIIYDATPNVVTQTDGLASSVAASDLSKWVQPYQVRVKTTDPAGTDYPNDWWNYHKTAIDSPPLETRLQHDGSHVTAQAACDERTELFRPWTRLFRCTVGLDKYALNPGDCVTVTYPRYGLSAGKRFRVASVKSRLSSDERAVDLVLVRRTLPDYSTASYV